MLHTQGQNRCDILYRGEVQAQSQVRLPRESKVPSMSPRRKSQNVRGFTLIDTLLTISIMAILAGVANTYVSDAADDAKAATVSQNLRSIATAATHVYNQKTRWQPRDRLHSNLLVEDSGGPGGNDRVLVKRPHLVRVPRAYSVCGDCFAGFP